MMDFSQHEKQGRFRVNRADRINAGVLGPNGAIIELQDSADITDLVDIGDNEAIGSDLFWRCYDPEFVRLGTRPAASHFPMATWDTVSGKKLRMLHGLHFGQLRGAERLDDKRLITWSRDFLIHVWDSDTGEHLHTLPLPAPLDRNHTPVVSSRAFSALTRKERASYVAHRDQPSFTVSLRLRAAKESAQRRLGPYAGSEPGGFEVVPFTMSGDNDRRFFGSFQEMEYIEAGYSTTHVMQDGRIVTGGTTYGSWDHVYVWDGALSLAILISGFAGSATFEIDGEIRPNVVQVSNYDATMLFENV